MEMRNEDKSYLIQERPWGRLNEMSNDRRNMKLQPLVAKEERDARLASRQADRVREADQAAAGTLPENPPLVQPQQPVSVPEPRPSETFVGSAVDTITNTASNLTGGIRQRAQAVAPTLFGGDPASQAANQEIARQSQN